MFFLFNLLFFTFFGPIDHLQKAINIETFRERKYKGHEPICFKKFNKKNFFKHTNCNKYFNTLVQASVVVKTVDLYFVLGHAVV